MTVLGVVPAVYLHHLPQLQAQLGIASSGSTLSHILISLAVLSAPGLLSFSAHIVMILLPSQQNPTLATAAAAAAVSPAAAAAAGGGGVTGGFRLVRRGQKPFVETAYAYLPLVWGGTLAHYWALLLGEGGHVAQVRKRSLWSNRNPLLK